MVTCKNQAYWHKILQCKVIVIGQRDVDGALRLETPFGTMYSYIKDLEEVKQ